MSGVNVTRIEAALMIVLSLAILATLTVIGVTLVAAMLVIPAVIARMLTDSFGRMLVYSTAIGTACGLVGMYLSYYAGVPSGTMIVLVGCGGVHRRPRHHRRHGGCDAPRGWTATPRTC